MVELFLPLAFVDTWYGKASHYNESEGNMLLNDKKYWLEEALCLCQCQRLVLYVVPMALYRASAAL